MVTTQDVKNTLGLSNQYDTQIDALIPHVYAWISGYCNIPQADLPDEYDLNAIRIIEFNLKGESGIQSKSISRVSYTYSDEYPDYCLKGLRRKLRW